MRTYSEHQGKTCLKPIGDIANIIENTSLEDLILFTIMIGKKFNKPQIQSPAIIIGFND